MINERNIHSRSIQKQTKSGIKELALTQHLFAQYAIFFYNSIVTIFCWLDLSLFFHVFDSNIDLTPSVSKNGISDYKNKVKIIVNMPGHILDLYCVRLLNAAPFAKIVQSFILMQNF